MRFKIKFNVILYMICFSNLFSLLVLFMFKENIESYNDYIIFLYGYIDVWNIENIISIMTWLLPQLFLLLLYGNFIENNFLCNISMIFTRTNKKEICLLHYLFHLFVQVIIFNIIMNVSHCILYYIFFHSFHISIKVCQYILVVMLWEIFILIFVNTLSIVMKSRIALLNVIIIQCFMITLIYISISNNYDIMKYVPITSILFCLKNIGITWEFHVAIRNMLILIFVVLADKRIIKKYSLGMKQRLGIAQAIMEKPDIIILDEPTNALDEDGVSLIYKLLLEEKKRGAIVIISSHHKEDLEQLCDVKIKMEHGVIV